MAVRLLSRSTVGRRMAVSGRYRILASAAAAFACNLMYALYHMILGILNESLWFVMMCAFYGILATMRFSAVLCIRRHGSESSGNMEYLVTRLSGVLLMVLGLILIAVISVSLSQNIATKYDEITMITIATYTFYKIAMAIRRAVKRRQNPTPLMKVIRNIGYAEVAASLLTLQRSMLVSFGSMEREQIQTMNALTGAAAFLFVLTLGISLTIQGRKERI